MKLRDESFGVFVANDGQGLILVDDFFRLNEKYVQVIFRVLRRPGGTTGGVYNTGVAVSSMNEDNLKGMIYYIKKSKRIWSTCNHADVELTKSHALYWQREMEENHK